MTHTYSILKVSKAAFDEIRKKLEAAGHHHAVHDSDEHGPVIDMHGIALANEDRAPHRPRNHR